MENSDFEQWWERHHQRHLESPIDWSSHRTPGDRSGVDVLRVNPERQRVMSADDGQGYASFAGYVSVLRSELPMNATYADAYRIAAEKIGLRA